MKKQKLLIMPDIHGRTFWKSAMNKIEEYQRVIFLGDYVDPYPFENISEEVAIENFKEILDLKKANQDKVVLLLGNHDMPYFSNDYLKLADWWSRHSETNHDTIARLFHDNMSCFSLAHSEADILFTHAGCTSVWIDTMFPSFDFKNGTIGDLCGAINKILLDEQGMKNLYMVTWTRGGYDSTGSCIWADVEEIVAEHTDGELIHPIKAVKQIFGHTQLAFADGNEIVYGDPIEVGNIKMLDTHKAFELDPEHFTLTPCTSSVTITKNNYSSKF